MKIKILNMLCFVLCVIAACGLVNVSAQVDNSVKLDIEFDRNAYAPGEIAEVTLYISDLADEAEAQQTIGAFEAHLQFDTEELDFIPTGADETPSEWLVEFDSRNDVDVFQVAQSYDDIVVLAFDKEVGFVPNCDSEGRFAVAKANFEVLACTDGKITIDFADTNDYPSVVAELKKNEKFHGEYTCTEGNAIEADVKDLLIADENAYINEEGTITDSVEILSVSGKAFLLARLYDAETGLLAAPVIFVEVESGRTFLENEIIFENVSSGGTYKIDYYLWDSGANSFLGLKPLTHKVTATVVAEGNI